MAKYARSADFDHEDARMTLFILTLGGDAYDWFVEKPQNSFNSLQSIIDAFKEKYGDKREGRHLVKAISIIKKRENETVEEFNKRFNGIVRELPQDYKPTDKALQDFYIDAFSLEPSYELRHARLNDYRDCQALAIELEKDKAASGKSEIPGFDRAATKIKEPKGKAVQEPEGELVLKLLQKIETMEINHNKEITTLQNRLIQMERAQTQNFQPRNNNNRNNNWQKKGQSSEQRPPNPLTNLVDNAPPYCQVCDALHEEATCPIVRRILDNGMFGTGDQINVVGSKFPLSMDDWIEVKSIKVLHSIPHNVSIIA